MPLTAREIAELLDLEPHPEGGFYREIYRSDESLPADALPHRYEGERCPGTAIYYLLTPDTFSALHRLAGDEVFHFYLGGAVTMLLLHAGGSSETRQLGTDLAAGERPVSTVPRNTWFGLFLNEGSEYALLGTTVAPGFEFEDFELGDRVELVEQYPERAHLIRRLTREEGA
jgi:hypothetical protein